MVLTNPKPRDPTTPQFRDPRPHGPGPGVVGLDRLSRLTLLWWESSSSLWFAFCELVLDGALSLGRTLQGRRLSSAGGLRGQLLLTGSWNMALVCLAKANCKCKSSMFRRFQVLIGWQMVLADVCVFPCKLSMQFFLIVHKSH